MRNKSVLAIDPGYDRVGLAVFDGMELVHSECFSPIDKDFSARLRDIYAYITNMLKKYKPDAVAIETLFFTKNVKTAIKVAEARGVAVLAAANTHTPLFEYSPQEVKTAVTGQGNASKDGVIKMVELTVKMPKKKRLDDEYDAIALGVAHQTARRQ